MGGLPSLLSVVAPPRLPYSVKMTSLPRVCERSSTACACFSRAATASGSKILASTARARAHILKTHAGKRTGADARRPRNQSMKAPEALELRRAPETLSLILHSLGLGRMAARRLDVSERAAARGSDAVAAAAADAGW